MGRTRLKVFVDASVLFSASDSPTGASRAIIRYGLRNEITLVISDLVLEETRRNLAHKRPEALDMFDLLTDTISFEVVKPTKDDILKLRHITAYKDAPILAAAQKAGVDYLVSFDRKHIIARREQIEKELECKVCLPEELLEELRQQATGS